jgi:hypothetical protein
MCALKSCGPLRQVAVERLPQSVLAYYCTYCTMHTVAIRTATCYGAPLAGAPSTQAKGADVAFPFGAHIPFSSLDITTIVSKR